MFLLIEPIKTHKPVKSHRSSNKVKFAFDPIDAVAHLRGADPLLAEVIARIPFALELRPVKSLFEALMRSIVYQQLHGRAAEAIHGRVVAELLT